MGRGYLVESGSLVAEKLGRQAIAEDAHGVVHGQRVADVEAEVTGAAVGDATQPVEGLVAGDGVHAGMLPGEDARLGGEGDGWSGAERIHVTDRLTIPPTDDPPDVRDVTLLQCCPEDVAPQPIYVYDDETTRSLHWPTSHPPPFRGRGTLLSQ